MLYRALRNLGMTLLAICASGTAWAAEPEGAFYKGKQIRLIVSSNAGTGYDAYARVLAQFMPKYIPGNPTIVVQNMGGASGLTGAGYVYNVAPRDGTVFASAVSNLPTTPLLSPEAAPFDVGKLGWIGSMSTDPYVGFVWHSAPIRTFEEAKTKEVLMGGTASVGSASVEMTRLSNQLFGTKFRLITGYKDTVETKLAIERGEVQGTFANAWGSLKVAEADWLRENKIRIIIQHGFHPHPELPDVPLLVDQAKTEADHQALELMLGRQEYSKPFFTPPGVPADLLEILRRAFDLAIKDPGLQAAMQKAKLDLVGPLTGAELEVMVKRAAGTPDSVVQRVKSIISSPEDTK